jgi:hypothetical protein
MSIICSGVFTAGMIRKHQIIEAQKRKMVIEFSITCDLIVELAKDFSKIDGGEESKEKILDEFKAQRSAIMQAYETRFGDGLHYLRPCER